MSGRGGEARGKEDEEGGEGRIEDTRDRAVDIVNGRERSRDLENKIVKKIKHSELVAVTRHFVTPASLHMVLLHPSVTWLGITLYNIPFPRSSLIFCLRSVFLSPGLFSCSPRNFLPHLSHRCTIPRLFYRSSTLVADQLHGAIATL